MASLSVRSSGAIVALPPAAWIALLDRLERPRGARGEDDMRAGRAQRFGGRGADPAAGAGDKRELAREGLLRRSSKVLLSSGWRPATSGGALPSRSQSVSVVG